MRSICELVEPEPAAIVNGAGPDPDHLRMMSVILDEDGESVGGG